MTAQDHTLLEQLPEAALCVRAGRILFSNSMARHFLPQLEEGALLPAELTIPACEPSGAGFFSAGVTTYSFRMTLSEQVQTILFRPAPQSALTDLQLEGALVQLRQLLGEFAAQVGPSTAAPSRPLSDASRLGFLKSYHRAFRLVNNLDYLRQAGTAAGAPFHSATMDLAGLCRTVHREAGDLLAEHGTTLSLTACPDCLLIPGDSHLLYRLLLGLLSNCVRSASGGTISMSLQRQGSRAVLSLTDSADSLSPEQLAAFLEQNSDQSLPLPGQGAGLGLTIARDIVSRHQGMLLVEWGDRAPILRVVLPTGPISPHLSVEAPRADPSGGLSPLFVELADVLPARAFQWETLE